MAEKIVMLALSPTMEAGTIAKWIKKEGDSISSGDVLCEVETDKATMDYESVNEGTLLKVLAGEGARVKVGETIGIAGAPGEDISALVSEPEAKKPTAAEKGEAKKRAEMESPVRSKPEAAPQAQVTVAEGVGRPPEGVKASPLARELARKLGVDIRSIEGTGPGGRVIKDDVEHYSEQKQVVPSAEGGETVPLSERRRVIAQRMTESMSSIPHFYLSVSVNMDSLIQARKELNSRKDKKVSFNAFLIKFAAEALKRHPAVNSSWQGDSIKRLVHADIGLAVAVKEGLITPVVRDCGNKGIVQIDDELSALIEKAKNGKLKMEEYTNASFTISNLGAWGVRQFTAIINPPASAILAVGEIFKEPVVSKDGNIVVQSSMIFTVSCDHRVIDGAQAAEFARELKNMLEDPINALY